MCLMNVIFIVYEYLTYCWGDDVAYMYVLLCIFLCQFALCNIFILGFNDKFGIRMNLLFI